MKKILTALVMGFFVIGAFGQADPVVRSVRFEAQSEAEMNAIPANKLQEGSVCYREDTDSLWRYNGSVWAEMTGGGGTGDFMADGSVPATGHFNMDENAIYNIDELLLKSQDVSVKSGTISMPTDDEWKFGKSNDNDAGVIFDLGGITGVIRTIEVPDKSGTMALLSDISGGISDGDKGDITVSSSGSVWSIDAGVVTETELNGSVNASLDLADSALQSSDIIDEDDMSSDSDTKVPTQQSVKAYVDSNSGSGDLWSDPVDSDVVPDTNNTYDLGSLTNRWLNFYGNVLNFTTGTASSISLTGSIGIGTYADFTPTDTEPLAQEGHVYFDDSENTLKQYNGTSWEALNGGGGGSSLPVDDTTALVQDPSDNTKQVRMDAENVGTGSTAVLSISGDNQFQDNLKVKGESVSNNSFFGLYKNDGTTIIGGFSGYGGTNTVEFGNSISSESFSIDGSGNYKLSGFSGGGNQGLGVDNTGQLFAADYVEGTISGRAGTDVTNVMLQTQAQFDSDGATSTGEVVFISDASPAEVVTSATIAMEGWKMYNDSSTDAATITLSDCDPGETLTVYINRASAPTLAGTGLTFNQLPNTTAFAAATDMMIIFEVSHDGTTIDYYYVER